MKKVAIVIDVSGSMHINSEYLKVFANGMQAKEVHIPREGHGSSVKSVNEIAKNFDIVYFFTDGYFYGKPVKKVNIIKLE